MGIKPRWSVLVLSLAFALSSLYSQTRADYFDQTASVLVPSTYDSKRTYPLLIWLPYTTGTAADFFERHADLLPLEDIIIMLPEGRPQSSDYLPNFMAYIGWYEERLLRDLDTLRSQYNIDTKRIGLGGFSLGGDLSWALLHRNPDLFSGAVMAGTRASYGTTKAGLTILKDKGFRAQFYIGSKEDTARYTGINRAWQTLSKNGITAKYTEIPGGGHVSGTYADFAKSMLWIIGIE